jgi:uncharacterized protein YbcI
VTHQVPAGSVSSSGRLNKEIANAVVRWHKRFLGRGPTRAQAFFRHNIVVVVMEASLTEAERRLAREGANGRAAVLEIRNRYEETMRSDLVQAVEALTGSRVEAFMSSHHIDPDLAANLFVLDRPVASEPEPVPPISDR